MQAGYTWLKRAGGYVTDVEIFVPRLSDGLIDPNPLRALNIFTNVFPATRTLEIGAPAHQLLPILSLPILRVGHLEELILNMTGNVSCFRNHTCNPVFSAAINLQKLKINSEFPLTITHPGELVVLQWHILRHIELTNIVCIKPGIVNGLLSRCYNLEYLTILWLHQRLLTALAQLCNNLCDKAHNSGNQQLWQQCEHR